MPILAASTFDGTKPLSCALGRHGELILAQGGGVQPKRWNGAAATATNAGIVAPAVAPACTLLTPVRYYVARCDVTKPGDIYHTAPVVTIGSAVGQPAGFEQAKAMSYLNQASLSEVRVVDGGRNYAAPPPVTLSATHGSGAILTAVMDGTPPAANAINQAEVTQGPPWSDELELPVQLRTQWACYAPVDITINNAGGTVNTSTWVYSEECDAPGGPLLEAWQYLTLSLTYTVQAPAAPAVLGTGCRIRIGFYGMGSVTRTTDPCVVDYWGAWGVSGVEVLAGGSGYTPGSAFTITIAPAGSPPPTASPPGKELIIECRTPEHSRNTGTPRFAVASVTVTNGGSNYVVAPEIRFDSPSGFGAAATCTVANGTITGVTVESGGGGYKSTPTVSAVSGGAECFAVARPHLRGKYQCYYRYVDNTPAASGGPIPSNLSPVLEVDATAGSRGLTWSVTGPANTDGRVLAVELWRSTGNQATSLYRVGTISASPWTYTDDLTDAELRDPDRNGYAAMPIVLPNGELNANRFTPPPNDKAVVVRFQDRFWYGVDTSGTEPNAVYFSEVDEPESVPEENEFVLQQNVKDGDAITALAPFGGCMLLFQARHVYDLTFAQKPLSDASVKVLSHRGCLNQRCWDLHAGVCYAMDQRGIYAITCGGQVEDISAPIADIFRDQLDYSATARWFLVVDPRTAVLRAFVTFAGDNSTGFTTRALCCNLANNSWWVERYPQRIAGGASAVMQNGDYRNLFAVQSGIALLDEGAFDIGRGTVTLVTLTNPGSGYRTPPTVSIAGSNGGSGAEFYACVNQTGGLSGIWIVSGGYGYTTGNLVIGPPNDPNVTPGVQATATFEATSTSTDTALHVPYRFKTGNYEYPTDMTAKNGGSVSPRDVSLTYLPQEDNCEVAMRLYFNNARHARNNVAPRNRGSGFRQGTADAATRLDMGALTEATGADTGVAKGLFAGRAIEDMRSADRHVAIELIGARMTERAVEFYELDAYGTSAKDG